RGAPLTSAVSRRRVPDRGRLAAVSHAGALRRRLFLDLQVQPAPHPGLSAAVGLHQAPLSRARNRRDGEAPSLRRRLLLPVEAQPLGHHPQGHAGRFHGLALVSQGAGGRGGRNRPPHRAVPAASSSTQRSAPMKSWHLPLAAVALTLALSSLAACT